MKKRLGISGDWFDLDPKRLEVITPFHFVKLAPQRAFTRLELLALISTALLIFAVTFPLLGNSRSRSDKLICQSNLRDIGRAYHFWASDHGDRNPFLVETNEGGIKGHYLAQNIWLQFAVLSNGLPNARVLVCPSDMEIPRIATDFSNNPMNGFVHPAFRNNAVSYFVGLHAFYAVPKALLAGDRNVRPSALNQVCSYAGISVAMQLNPRDPAFRWLDNIHGTVGNLLFNDGRVVEALTQDLREAFRFQPIPIYETTHILPPR